MVGKLKPFLIGVDPSGPGPTILFLEILLCSLILILGLPLILIVFGWFVAFFFLLFVIFLFTIVDRHFVGER